MQSYSAEARDAARQRARQAAADVWSRAGRAEVRLTSEEHVSLFTVLYQHVVIRFGSVLPEEVCGTVVETALSRHLPPLYLRHTCETGAGPDDLLAGLDDAALDLLGDRRVAADTCQRQRDDEQLVRAVFGHGDMAYRAALHEVRVAGSRMEFLVVTEYMSRRQVRGDPPPPAEVADALADHGVTAADVERLMFRFSRRLSAQSP